MNDRNQNHVPRLHIVGRKNSGKTTLVCALVTEFSRRGLQVATIKHTHHAHELDTPGKDSHQHRVAGAAGVGILSPQMTAAFVPVQRTDNETERYGAFEVMFRECDLILVEGDLNTSAPKIEVWRSVVSEQPYAAGNGSVRAVVSDECPKLPHQQPIWSRSDLTEIADQLLAIGRSAD